jgi:hypothetical protein
MTYKTGEKAPSTGIYWCSVCKTPTTFERDQALPECRNKCGRGRWELVRAAEEQPTPESKP